MNNKAQLLYRQMRAAQRTVGGAAEMLSRLPVGDPRFVALIFEHRQQPTSAPRSKASGAPQPARWSVRRSGATGCERSKNRSRDEPAWRPQQATDL